MNLLIDQFPRSVEVNGKLYAVDADYRNCLRIILAFEDPELVDFEKQLILFNNLFIERPPDVAEGLKRGVWFLNGGKEEAETDGPRVFSFEKDDAFIFSAFQQTHGVDLEKETFLHWWKFLALFMDLGPDTVFCNLVGLRKRIKTGKASKEDRIAARAMGDIFTIEELDDRTPEEIEAERVFMASLGTGLGG